MYLFGMEIELSNRHRQALKEFMKKNGLKIFPWCNKAGVSEGTLRNFLKEEKEGEKLPRTKSMKVETLKKLAGAAHTTISAMLGENVLEESQIHDHEKRIGILETAVLQMQEEIAKLSKLAKKNFANA